MASTKDGSGQSKDYNTDDIRKVITKTGDRGPQPKEVSARESVGRNASGKD